jgi:alpha-ribazole phosphatase
VPRLLLVRHGRTNLQKEDRYWGSTDIPLSDVGIKQAEQVRDRLAGEKITHVYSSTLGRSKDTAKIITAPHKKDITACPEICEFNFGYAEGLTYEEIKKLHPSLAEELAKMGEISFPGGESLEKFYNRTQAFIKRLEQHKQADVIAVVAHAGSLRMLICHLLGLEQKMWYRMRIDYASLSIVEMYSHISIIDFLNDTHHLKPLDY